MTVNSDINFKKLTELHRKNFPRSTFNITEALLLTLFLESYLDISLASKFDSNIYTNPLRGIMAGKKLSALKEKKIDDMTTSQLFQEQILDSGRTLREVINNGERNLTELIALLHEAEKFKEWTSKIDNDKKLINEYINSLNSISWIEKLPTKIVRLLIATTIGHYMGEGAGTLAASVDTLVIGQAKPEWKPSMFIEHLECFTAPSMIF